MSEWPFFKLSEVCEIRPPKKLSKAALADGDMVSFVPMSDLGELQKYFTPLQEKSLGEVYSGYTYFANGDVLLAKITPCFENGKLGIASGLQNGIGFGSSEYVVFRPNDNLSSEYLYYFLSQDQFRSEGARVMTGAVGHKRVPKEFIAEYLIPLPPLSEQKRIVEILDEVFEKVATLETILFAKMELVAELKSTSLQEAFQGKL